MGIVLYSGAIIISLFAMRARAPQWLLMFCGGWTLFTLLNVAWQPLIVFQLALIWGGYAFFAPKGLSQRKFWESDLWEAWLDQSAGLKPVQMPCPAKPLPSTPATDQEQAMREAVGTNPPASYESSKRRRLNKSFIAQIFIVILAINIVVHLYPFDYSSILAMDEIARAFGTTVAIFLVSLVGLLFRPSKTFGVATIAILAAPVMILLDRANDPIAPQIFRELLYSNSKNQNVTLTPDAGRDSMVPAANVAAVDEHGGDEIDESTLGVASGREGTAASIAGEEAVKGQNSEYRRMLNNALAANPLTNPSIFDTSDMPLTKAANAAISAQREADAANPVNGYELAIMSYTGAGVKSAKQIEKDFLSLSPFQFRIKYGEHIGEKYSEAYSRGESAYRFETQSNNVDDARHFYQERQRLIDRDSVQK